jgi:tetratricopeptide (TPR) repeat protein
LLASGLHLAPAAEDMGEADENLLHEAIREIQSAQQEIDLPPPYRAILARCHFRLGALHDAMAEYELLLKATTDSPWLSLKPHVYRAISTCHVQEGDLKKAIKTLKTCTEEFPRETHVYLEIADLQARDTDFAGAAETVRKAVEMVPELDVDWRLSTVLALRSILDSPERMLQDKQIQKVRESHPNVWHLIERTCKAYWPTFNHLCDVARERWTLAILQGYYFAKQEEIARLVLEETAIKLFAMAVEIELRSRVFDLFKEQVSKDSKLQKSARSGIASRGEAKIFSGYLVDHRHLSFGAMATIIRLSQRTEEGILAEFRTWLTRWQPKVSGLSESLNVILEDRNLATHEGLSGGVGIEEIHRACQTVISSLHRI